MSSYNFSTDFFEEIGASILDDYNENKEPDQTVGIPEYSSVNTSEEAQTAVIDEPVSTMTENDNETDSQDDLDSKSGESKSGSLEQDFSIGGTLNGHSFIGTDGIDFVTYENHRFNEVTVTPAEDDESDAWTLEFGDASDSKSSSPAGTDYLEGIERLEFIDSMVALDLELEDPAGAALALTFAAFDNIVDSETLGFWIAQADSLWESSNDENSDVFMDALAQQIIDHYAPEIDNAAVVHLLYTNIVGQEPTAAEADSFVQLIENGTFTQASIFTYAASLDLNTEGYQELTTSGLNYQAYDHAEIA